MNSYNHVIITGKLTREGDSSYLIDANGKKHFEHETIWDGYLRHWTEKTLNARYLQQKDYTTLKPIVIMWPRSIEHDGPLVELYFNERLVKYPASLLGHVAINVKNEIFNFSHNLNENEAMKPEEYFFRPALGEFAPHPETLRFDISDPVRPYYDKFGRLFMRTIHVFRIEGLDCDRLSEILHGELKTIYSSESALKGHEKYQDFHVLTRNCATIIRDSFRQYGFAGIKGNFPRELYVHAAHYFKKNAEKLKLTISQYTLKQLKVDEAPFSAMPPLLNPANIIRARLMKYPTFCSRD